MIYYLHLIGEFWFCSVAKVAEWFLETIFLRNFLSGGGRTMKSKLDGEEEELELGLGSVTFTRGLGRLGEKGFCFQVESENLCSRFRQLNRPP